MSQVIALLTDFGTTDTYVGVMKGVMLNIHPDLQFVDLTHAIEPQNIKQAAFALVTSYRFFPPNTIFLAVVDPGVGSPRRPVAFRAYNFTFIAPDNGVLSYVVQSFTAHTQWIELTNLAYHLGMPSHTFHGRDVFAPAAAHLAAGTQFAALGDPMSDPVMLPAPRLIVEPNHISGEVMHIDHFGNAVTSIGPVTWNVAQPSMLTTYFPNMPHTTFSTENTQTRVGDALVYEILHTYAEAEPNAELALVGSSNYLELAVSGGSFAERFGVKIGDPVELQIG